MNPRTRRAALYGIALIALLASLDALAHSYTGLYGWAVHHRLGGWQALSWPAEIDVFLVVGELALYVAYLDAWPARLRLWPWLTAITGLLVSVAGNVGHVEPLPDAPVTLADRVTAAASPVAAFAGLLIGFLVLKMSNERIPNREEVDTAVQRPAGPLLNLKTESQADGRVPSARTTVSLQAREAPLLRDARLIFEEAHANGQKVSQRALATELRDRGHRFSNSQLRIIAGIAAAGCQASDSEAA